LLDREIAQILVGWMKNQKTKWLTTDLSNLSVLDLQGQCRRMVQRCGFMWIKSPFFEIKSAARQVRVDVHNTLAPCEWPMESCAQSRQRQTSAISGRNAKPDKSR
jgi:hypothetical protein